MNTVKYNPFTTYRSANIDRAIDDFFGRPLADIFGSSFQASTPSINIIEEDEGYEIEVAAPGLKKDDFSITLDKDALVISAKKEVSDSDETKGSYTRKEFSYTSFERKFHISDDIDIDSIDANYTNGILKVSLTKKAKSTPEVRTIEIG